MIPVPASVLLRGQAAVLLEHVREIALARKRKRRGDLGNRIRRRREHRFGGLELLGEDVRAHGRPGLFLEKPRKIRRGQIRHSGQRFQSHARVQMPVDVVDRGADRLRRDRAPLEVLHLLCVVQAHLVVDLGDLFGGGGLVGEADVVVAQRVSLGL